MWRRIIILSILLATLATAVAEPRRVRRRQQQRPNRESVSRQSAAERRRLEQLAAERNNTLEETARQLEEAGRLEVEIARLEENIRIYQPRVDSIGRQVDSLTQAITALESRHSRLQQSYAESLRAIRGQRQAGSAAAFIFSAENFSQAWRRLRYLRQLNSWTRAKADELAATGRQLEHDRDLLRQTMEQHTQALQRLQAQWETLSHSQAQANLLVERLRQQTANIDRLMQAQRQKIEALDAQIEQLIREEEEARRREEEAARRREEERRRREQQRRDSLARASANAPSPVSPAPAQSPAQPAPPRPGAADSGGAGFAGARGRLPMPVGGNAQIVGTFGRSAHVQYSRVETQNNGIDIAGEAGSNVTAVFDGTVSMVIVMEGYGNVVILRHGEYLTVYAGIDTLAVRKGQTVRQGQTLGTLAAGLSGTGRLHFEVRHEREKLDPRLWLR